ncbi:MAG: ABC transporter ATP-binding protein [Pseudomonadota bacterium]|nr:ABC transporter ATP-binding protein [Pseudomonadota bacterium]
MITIELKNLNKNFGEIRAIKDFNLTAEKGQIIALLGPNGAGKSTLMNMITGYLTPSSGEIKILGRNIEQYPLEARRNIGFLSEGAPLYPDMSVAAFLAYMAELRGFSGRERRQQVEQAATTAKIEPVMGQKIETLSKGYVRRVGFAQSILSDPEILLLDEPTDGLDPNQKQHIRGLIEQMGRKKTILISTHLLEEAETVCNRIVLINKGEIVADGTLSEVLKQTKAKSLEKAFAKLTTTEDEA